MHCPVNRTVFIFKIVNNTILTYEKLQNYIVALIIKKDVFLSFYQRVTVMNKSFSIWQGVSENTLTGKITVGVFYTPSRNIKMS